MGARLASGLVLAAVAALVIGLSDVLGLDLQHVALLGAALGGALGLIPHRSDWGKLAGFGVGFVVAWLGFALRAAVLPDAASGRAVAALIVVALLAVMAAVSCGRLPLWSGLLGAAAIVGAYEEVYTTAPSQFVAESPAAATTVLLAAALGYLATSLLPVIRPEGRHAGPERLEHESAATESDIDALMAGEQQ
ncbi:MAG: hypothetical protein ACTHJJ_18515 [Intrasporangium sp.]|uniref:hypothetical protein n=1 Tax=Intrasporangium sp. TaxID=1925024 RepID=UPI003F80D295